MSDANRASNLAGQLRELGGVTALTRYNALREALSVEEALVMIRGPYLEATSLKGAMSRGAVETGYLSEEVVVASLLRLNQAEHQPRVVVVFHLFFKLPAEKDGKSKYGPKPLPEMKEAPKEGEPGTVPFNARVRVTKFSKPRDPNSVSYKEAFMMAEAEIIEGPLAGKKVGLVHEVMHKGRLAKQFEKNRTPRFLNQVINLRLVPWELARKNAPELGTTMIYDDTELDLDAPIFWVQKGPLDQHSMRSR